MMRDEDYHEIDDDGNIINPDHDGGIYTAVHAWYKDPAAAKARYGFASAPGMRISTRSASPEPTTRKPAVRLSADQTRAVGAQLFDW